MIELVKVGLTTKRRGEDGTGEGDSAALIVYITCEVVYVITGHGPCRRVRPGGGERRARRLSQRSVSQSVSEAGWTGRL